MPTKDFCWSVMVMMLATMMKMVRAEILIVVVSY